MINKKESPLASFTLKPRWRIEKEIRIWDSPTGKWIVHRHDTPKLLENPPQDLTPSQTKFLNDYAKSIAENIKLNTELRNAAEERKKRGPLDCVYFHYQVLEHNGFSKIEDMPGVRQLIKYLWSLVDRYENKEIDWDTFEDQVERWYIQMLDKCEALKGPQREVVSK